MKWTEYKLYYFHANHLGSGSLITDLSGNTYQTLAYAPFGETLVNQFSGDYDEAYKFGGHIKDNESNLSYYGARYFDDNFGSITPDAMWYKRPDKSPYLLCSNNPVMRIDVDGNWDVKVSAYSNQGKSPYAVYSVYNRNGDVVYQTVVKVQGQHRIRNKTNGDTPQGRYKILGWRKTGNERYPRISFGPNELLALDYQDKEGGDRNGMHTHGGRQEGQYEQRTELMNTFGCIRINDQDIKEIKQITDFLEANDPLEQKGYLTLTDDLQTPVKYSDRDSIKDNVILNGGTLQEVVVTPNNNNNQIND